MDMKPQGMAIAQTVEEYTYSETEEPEAIEPAGKKTLFNMFRKRPEQDGAVIEKPDNNPISAVALLKNNKITVDNFTLEDFTNLKNMV